MLPRRSICVAISIALILLCAYVYFNRGPSFELMGDEEMTLFSLDPFARLIRSSDEVFRFSYKVIGKTDIVESDVRKQVAQTVNRSLQPFGGHTSFFPRFGLRVVSRNQTREYLFHFGGPVVVSSGDSRSEARITKEPKPVFERILTSAGIELPPERPPSSERPSSKLVAR